MRILIKYVTVYFIVKCRENKRHIYIYIYIYADKIKDKMQFRKILNPTIIRAGLRPKILNSSS